VNVWLFGGAVILIAALLRLGRLRELHHGYYGFALGVFAAMVGAPRLEIVALVILWDDTIQHAIQCVYPAFLSPLHWLYGVTLWRLSLVRRLNAWLDEEAS
jgi:hypothetical protein